MEDKEKNEQIKMMVSSAKKRLTELDLLISKMESVDLYKDYDWNDTHIPTEGQPYFYGAEDSADKNPGILIPANQIGCFRGVIRIESDATFVAQDILGAQEVIWTDAGGLASDPDAGTYIIGCSKAYQGERFSSAAGTETLLGHDFGWRLIDDGSGRRLYQAIDENNDEQFIPSKFLRSGFDFRNFVGPNYTQPFVSEHIFAKNTAIRVEIQNYAPFTDDVRVHITLLGYKVFGD